MGNSDILNTMTQIRDTEKLLPNQVADRIKTTVIDKQLKVGDRLPNEFELAQTLHVGRGTIREAVKILVAQNVLEIRRGIGTFVADHTGYVDDPFGFAYLGDDAALIEELFPIRMQIEPWVCEMAAQKASQEQIDRLERHMLRCEKLILAHENHLFEDQKFHTCIADCTGNRVLSKLVPVITYTIHTFGRMTNLSKGQETIETHRAIFEAIRAHDPQAARLAMIQHLMMNREAIQALNNK